MLHTAICIFLPRLKDLFPRCWMIDLRGQSSQLIVLCWEVTSPKEKYSSWSHHWLNVECKCLASLPCHWATLMGQSSFKGPVDSAEGLLWLHYGPISTLSFFTLISMQIYFNIFRSTHQLTSYILISVFLEMQTAAIVLKVVKETESKMKFWVWVIQCLSSNEDPFLAINGVLIYCDILLYQVVV